MDLLRPPLYKLENNVDPVVDNGIANFDEYSLIEGEVFASYAQPDSMVRTGEGPHMAHDINLVNLFTPQELLQTVNDKALIDEGNIVKDKGSIVEAGISDLELLFEPQEYIGSSASANVQEVAGEGAIIREYPYQVSVPPKTPTYSADLINEVHTIVNNRFSKPMPRNPSANTHHQGIDSPELSDTSARRETVPKYRSLREQMRMAVLDNTARLMQIVTEAMNFASCADGCMNGSCASPPRILKEDRIHAYDMAALATRRLLEQTDIQEALSRGKNTEVAAKLQEEVMITYGRVLGMYIPQEALNASRNLVSTNTLDGLQAIAASFASSMGGHVNCSCHGPTIPGGSLTNIRPQYASQFMEYLMQRFVPNEEMHNHKHEIQHCASCGYTGEICTSSKCPRCGEKEWISHDKYKELIREQELGD